MVRYGSLEVPMLLAQFASTAAIHPKAANVRVLAGTAVNNEVESKRWCGRQWAVMENAGKVQISQCDVKATREKSSDPSFPDTWSLSPSIPGRVVFFFQGIKPTQASCSLQVEELPYHGENRSQIHSALVKFKNKTYTFNYGAPFPNQDKFEVFLTDGNAIQRIGIRDEYTSFKILWAGDLNGDGLIDFLATAENDKSRGTTALFMGVPGPVTIVALAYFDEEEGPD